MVHDLPLHLASGISVVHADTSRERPVDRAEYWNEVVRKHVVELECEAKSSHELLCAMDGFSCAAGAATLISVGRLSVRRFASAVDRERTDAVILNLLIQGEMYVSQLGTQGLLTPGDFSICLADKPYELQIPKGMQVACFRLPVENVGMNRTALARLAAQTFCGEGGMIPLVRAYALALLKQRHNFNAGSADSALRQMASIVGAVAQEATHEKPSQQTEHRERLILQAKFLVDRDIDDEKLSAASVAAEMRVSARYLQRLWASETGSLAAYIADKRLDRVSASLRNPAKALESLTQIAMSHGFVNMSHFSRTFRDRHGVTPTSYRQVHSGSAMSIGPARRTSSESPGTRNE